MSYAIYDINSKRIGDFTSAGGLNELADEVRKNSLRWPELNQFLRTGKGLITKKLLKEVVDFRNRAKDRMLKDIASDLHDLLMRSEEFAIISD